VICQPEKGTFLVIALEVPGTFRLRFWLWLETKQRKSCFGHLTPTAVVMAGACSTTVVPIEHGARSFARGEGRFRNDYVPSAEHN
jgi:hypothetical protein